MHNDGTIVQYAVRWIGNERYRRSIGAPEITDPVPSLRRAQNILRVFGGRGEIVERQIIVTPWRAHDMVECGCELSPEDAPKSGGT